DQTDGHGQIELDYVAGFPRVADFVERSRRRRLTVDGGAVGPLRDSQEQGKLAGGRFLEGDAHAAVPRVIGFLFQRDLRRRERVASVEHDVYAARRREIGVML